MVETPSDGCAANTSGVFWFVLWLSSVALGASLTSTTVIETVAVLESPVPSLILYVKLSLPL